MSSQDRPPGSARKRSRLRLTLTWTVIGSALVLFTSVVVAGAGVSGKPDYTAAVKALPRSEVVVMVGSSGSDDSFFARFSSSYARHELCAVSRSQLARIAQVYSTGSVTIPVQGTPVEVVTVSGKGANDNDLRRLLGDPRLTCKLVRQASVFYLPFDAHVS